MNNIIINDRYILRNAIGHGGFSKVFSAFDKVSNKDVAIKILNFDITENEKKYAMFKQEAMTLAAISNKNIVKVYESNLWENKPFLVMEYVRGKSLRNIINEQSYLLVEEVYLYTQQILNGLESIHDAGVVHRDIKPHNVVKKADGTLVLIDFGTATIQEENKNLYKEDSGNTIGTVQYMAPEILLDNKSASAQSDIYALGITLYEMFTGKFPFNSTNPSDKKSIALMHIHAEFPSVRKLNPQVPVEFENIIYKCCEKELSKRYKNVNEIKADLFNAYNVYKNPKKEKKGFFQRIFKKKG